MTKLPDVEFVNTNPQEIIDSIMQDAEAAAGRPLAAADPLRLFLLSLAYIIVQQNIKINNSGKSNLLYYAKDAYLDHLGAFRQTPRLEAEGALTTMRFTLSQARPSAIGIPQGTRVTAAGDVFFATAAPAVIAAGHLYVDVAAEAVVAGTDANGLEVGTINELVDPIPFVNSVSNLDVSGGGADREPDDDYFERIYKAPAAFSTAGPEDAYIYWALTASPSIIDVKPITPSPAVAHIYILLQNGTLPDQAILDAVEAALTPRHIRPLTDYVKAFAPDVVNYNLDISYYVRMEDVGSLAQIQERVDAAVADYLKWQRTKMGRDINPDELICKIREAGAKRVAISEPIFTRIQEHEVAQEDSVYVGFGGLEDE